MAKKMHWKEALDIYAKRHGIDYVLTGCCGTVFRYYRENAESVDVSFGEIGKIIEEESEVA